MAKPSRCQIGGERELVGTSWVSRSFSTTWGCFQRGKTWELRQEVSIPNPSLTSVLLLWDLGKLRVCGHYWWPHLKALAQLTVAHQWWHGLSHAIRIVTYKWFICRSNELEVTNWNTGHYQTLHLINSMFTQQLPEDDLKNFLNFN